MPKWTDYTIKTEPADNDEVMVLDTAGKANKRLGLSALSDWIIEKIANKVFENLQTQNKTILGALNELNSNRVKYYIITTTDVKYKEAFEEWYLNVEEHTACIVYIYAGWEKIIVGFKSDNSYGAFASIAYDESNISMFCKIYDKKFKY